MVRRPRFGTPDVALGQHVAPAPAGWILYRPGTMMAGSDALRVTLGLFALQMAGTFLVLILQPDVAFQRGNPLLLTVEGEFVIKNLVLLSAGMVVGATVRRRQAIARSGTAQAEVGFSNV